jgi:hypothetical protein
MTDDERKQEGAEESVEDLEAPAAEQGGVAGGIVCRPTNACAPVNTVVHCLAPTQLCEYPTCKVTTVRVA